MSMLKCSRCGDDNLNVSVSTDGLDCDSLHGSGSGFNSVITLTCPKCNCVYIVGRVHNLTDFSADVAANHFTYNGLEESRKFPKEKVWKTSELSVSESQKAILRISLFKEQEKAFDYWSKRKEKLKKLLDEGCDKKVVDGAKRIVQAAEIKVKDIADLIKQLSN